MSQIHFIGGEKGGVGKSLLARVLAQHFIDRNLPFIGYDTDRSHGALLRYYGDYAAPMPLDTSDSLDPVIEAAAAQPERRVLVDLAAQTQATLAHWIEDAGVFDVARDIGTTLRYWHVMDASRDSVDLLAWLLNGFGAQLPLVLVLNEVRGERFDLLQNSGLLERAQAHKAEVMSLRKLPDATMQKLDGQSTSFWAAVHAPDRAATGLGLLERQRVKVWLQRTYAEFDRIGA
jgi:hypothetical protein